MVRLSVNINKVALIRNARGQNFPNLIQFAKDCESFGAQGITVHPRPDERHVRFSDLEPLKECIQTEFNIEGYPSRKFIDHVCRVKPDQVTLVPDPPGVLTSNEGWDTIKNASFLKEVLEEFKSNGIRTSIFLETKQEMLEGALNSGTDRIELYTGKYAHEYSENPEIAIEKHILISKLASQYKIGLNAGHDLNLKNLKYYSDNVVGLKEVSIGHALIADALYFGIQNTIGMYLRLLKG